MQMVAVDEYRTLCTDTPLHAKACRGKNMRIMIKRGIIVEDISNNDQNQTNFIGITSTPLKYSHCFRFMAGGGVGI